MDDSRSCTCDLSKREREIAAYLGAGASFALAAQHFCLSTATVQSHAKRIYRKIGVHSRHELCERLSDPSTQLDLDDVPFPLTDRERDVASCLAKGMTRLQTAHHLGISPQTVKAYARTLFDKLGIDSRDELFEWTQRRRS